MSQNIFKIYDGRMYFDQWDTKQKLIVLNNTIEEVHFSNKNMVHSIPAAVQIENDGTRVCNIPDVLLQIPKNLIASAYVIDESGNRILRTVKFAVRQRPIPSDYVIDPTDEIADLDRRLDKLEDESGQSNWDQHDASEPAYIQNRTHYDSRDYHTATATLWQGGEGGYAEIDNELWEMLLSEAAVITSYEGVYLYEMTMDDHVQYWMNGDNEQVLCALLNEPKAYIRSDVAKGTFETWTNITCECTYGELKQLDKKYLPEDALTEKYMPKMSSIILLDENWDVDESLYSQIVTVDGATKNSKVDLQPSANQLLHLQDEEVALLTENTDGVVKVWAIGDKPSGNMTFQVLLTEVVASMSVIYGNIVGGSAGFGNTLILEDEYGNQLVGVVTDEVTLLTATADDIKLGKVAATASGIAVGTHDCE